MDRRCDNCDHVGVRRFGTLDGTVHEVPNSLVCRRYPPSFTIETPFSDGNIRSTAEWPGVHADDRCGEFTPKASDEN